MVQICKLNAVQVARTKYNSFLRIVQSLYIRGALFIRALMIAYLCTQEELSFTFKGFSIDGTALEATQLVRSMEIIGDSITAG